MGNYAAHISETKRTSNALPVTVSHKMCDKGSLPPRVFFPLAGNVAESRIVLNCSVGTKWIPALWEDKVQQLGFGAQPCVEPVHLQ